MVFNLVWIFRYSSEGMFYLDKARFFFLIDGKKQNHVNDHFLFLDASSEVLGSGRIITHLESRIEMGGSMIDGSENVLAVSAILRACSKQPNIPDEIPRRVPTALLNATDAQCQLLLRRCIENEQFCLWACLLSLDFGLPNNRFFYLWIEQNVDEDNFACASYTSNQLLA